MKPARSIGMLFRLAAVLLALPSAAAAQPWADAYRAGDYRKAAALLHEIVADHEYAHGGDPSPIRQLALMYANGIGVPHDAISACSLAQLMEAATMMWAPQRFRGDVFAYQAALKEAEGFKAEHCSRLSRDEMRDAVPACFALGMPRTVLEVGGRQVIATRRSIRLADTADEDVTHANFCATLFAGVHARSVAPPDDAAPDVQPRHFVELFLWMVGRDRNNGSLKYLLRWQAHEVLENEVRHVADSEVLAVSEFPLQPAPADLDRRVSMEMLRSGHIRWRIPGAPPTRGWIMRPEEGTRR